MSAIALTRQVREIAGNRFEFSGIIEELELLQERATEIKRGSAKYHTAKEDKKSGRIIYAKA